MPTTPYAKVLVSVNGGANDDGGITVANGDTIALTPESTAGWGSPAPEWQIYSYTPGFSCPAGWSTKSVAQPDGTTASVYYYDGTTPPSFTMPSAPWFGKLLFGLYVNGGGGALTDESSAVRVQHATGFNDVRWRETSQFGGNEKWAKDFSADLILMATGALSSATATYATVAQLEAVDETTYQDGAYVSVASLRALFMLVLGSTATNDDLTIVKTLGGTGMWHRVQAPCNYWLLQPTWYISSSGNDENNGLTSGTALKTIGEFARRIRGGSIQQNTTVYVKSSFTTEDVELHVALAPGVTLQIYDDAPAVAASGTLSSVTNSSGATSTLTSATDSGLATSWTASSLVRTLLKVNKGGGVYAYCWVEKDLGAKAARLTDPFDIFGGYAPTTIANTNTYQALTLKQFGRRLRIYSEADIGSGSYVWFINLQLGDTSHGVEVYGEGVYMDGCKVCNLQAGNSSDIYASASQFTTSATFINARATLTGCLLYSTSTMNAVNAGSKLMVYNSTYSGADVTVRQGGSVEVNSSGWMAINDTGANGINILSGASFRQIGYLFGTGINGTTGYGIWVDAGGTYAFNSSKVPAITGGGAGDTFVGGGATAAHGITTAYASLGDGIECNGASLVATAFAHG